MSDPSREDDAGALVRPNVDVFLREDEPELPEHLDDADAFDDFGRLDVAADDGGRERDDTPYELPEIVPATLDVPGEPRLPTRPAVARPAAVAPDPAPAPAPAAAVAPPAVAPETARRAGWGELVPTRAARPTAQLRAPGRRPRVRRVTRVVRHVDPWSVFKVALIFSVVAYLSVLTSGVLLWRVADSTGTLDNVERWFTQFGWETFELKGDEVFANAWVIGLFAAVGLTGTAVLMATLFNLVSDIVGGVRVTVLEEEVVERTASSARRYVVRRPPLAEPGASAAPGWQVDDDEPVEPPAPVTRPTPSPTAADPATRRATTGSTDWSVDDD